MNKKWFISVIFCCFLLYILCDNFLGHTKWIPHVLQQNEKQIYKSPIIIASPKQKSDSFATEGLNSFPSDVPSTFSNNNMSEELNSFPSSAPSPFSKYNIPKELEEEMESRMQKAQEICRKYREEISGKRGIANTLVNYKAGIGYCRHGKAGTGTFLNLLYDISNITNHPNIYVAAASRFRAASVKNYERFLKNNVLFTVIRHPFTRIVSAYRKKLKKSYAVGLQRRIIKRYRSPSTNLSKWTNISDFHIELRKHPTFEEFVKHLNNAGENCLSDRTRSRRCFSHFDVHWRPFYARCNPCKTPFHAIVKLEHVLNDMNYVTHMVEETYRKRENEARMANVSYEELSQMKKKHEFSLSVLEKVGTIKKHETPGISTGDLTRRFMTMLSNKDKKRLRNVYRNDFLLFDYDPYEYDK